MARNTVATNMSLVLNRRRIPEKAGNTRCPIANTIVAKKPTVKACRDAPQMPCEFYTEAAQILSAPATKAQMYAKRTKTGKLVCTPLILAGRALGSSNRSEYSAAMRPATRTRLAAIIQPAKAIKTPATGDRQQIPYPEKGSWKQHE